MSDMTERNDVRCAHEACQSVISGGDSPYCSDYCRQAAQLGDSTAACACGHIDCESFCMHAPSFYRS